MTDTISKTNDDSQVIDSTEDAEQLQRSVNDRTPASPTDSSWAAMPVASSTAGRECVDVDPTSLIIGDNVRAGAHLDRQFLASLREFGVMDPIHVTRADDGTLTVKRGQRRTLGAVQAGLPLVPVLVVADDDSEADRITKQWHENERRDALTDTDRLTAVEQLTILGVPAGSIAKRLGTPRKVIDAAVQANGSDLAKTAAAKHTLTLTDAALIAEFEDQEQVVNDILRAVERGDSGEHVAQRARDESAREKARQEAADALTKAGVTVIDHPGYDDKTIKELREVRLLNKDGSAKKKAPNPSEHASCPGHAAYLTLGWGSRRQYEPTYVCTAPKANGHARATYHGVTLPGQSNGGGMTDEQKAERKALVANNKSWDSAATVRRAWLTESFLTRTTAPKERRRLPGPGRRQRRTHPGRQPALRDPDRHHQRVQQHRDAHPARQGRPTASSHHARHRPARLRVGVRNQPQHLASPHRPRPPLPQRPHRVGLQAFRRRAAHPRPTQGQASTNSAGRGGRKRGGRKRAGRRQSRRGRGRRYRAGRRRGRRAGRGRVVKGMVLPRTWRFGADRLRVYLGERRV